MDIYQSIWDADMSGNGVKPVLKGADGNDSDGYVVVNEQPNGDEETKLFPKLVLPERKKKTYELCMKLFNNYCLSPSMPEVNTLEEQEEVYDFIEAIIPTKPMKIAREWLQNQTGEGFSDSRFFKLILDIWFTQFTQSSGKDLSAFEHVIVGEQKRGQVSGYHFWYKYYLDDSNGLLDTDTIRYKGLKGGNIQENLVVPEVSTLSYCWDAFDYQSGEYRPLYKKIGGFFNGCSVEGLMALGTVRFAGQGRAPKEAIINGALYDMKLYRSTNDKHMRTFYPVFKRLVGATSFDPDANPPTPIVIISDPGTNSGDVFRNQTVKIIAALVNPPGHDVEKETVTLFNISPDIISLKGWKIIDKNSKKFAIEDPFIEPGQALRIELPAHTAQLSNKGGLIKLQDASGNMIQTVHYTREQARKVGWTIMF